MNEFIATIVSAAATFFAHYAAERLIAKKRKKGVRFVLRGYHIHHSFFGIVLLAAALTVAGGIYAFIMFGYGIGNLWQHKYTHNKANEPGMVFIQRLPVGVSHPAGRPY